MSISDEVRAGGSGTAATMRAAAQGDQHRLDSDRLGLEYLQFGAQIVFVHARTKRSGALWLRGLTGGADVLSGKGEATSSPIKGRSPGRPGGWKWELFVAWILLVVAGLLEVVWAFSMKQSEGFTRLAPSLVTIGAMIVSFALLSWSMRTLPLGTAYTVWTGIGAVGAFLVGIAVLGESANAMRVAAALLIVAGLVLMKVSSPA